MSPFQKFATLNLVPTAKVFRRSTVPPEKAAWISCFSYLYLIWPLLVAKEVGKSMWVDVLEVTLTSVVFGLTMFAFEDYPKANSTAL